MKTEKHRRIECFPYIPEPDVQQIIGQPDSCWELVNRYGTYEVQQTQDTDNPRPTIAQGYPKGEHRDDADPWNT